MGECEAETEDDNIEDFYLDTQPAYVFLTGKAASSEISLQILTEEDRQKFEVSMQKERDSWKKFGAVEVLTKEQIADLPDDAQIVGTMGPHRQEQQAEAHGQVPFQAHWQDRKPDPKGDSLSD